MTWTDNQNYLEGTFNNFQYKPKVAAFDIDDTLIKVKSTSRHYPLNSDDWRLFDESVPAKLKELHDQGFCLVFISNQSGMSTGKVVKAEWSEKLDKVNAIINLPVKVFAACAKDKFRKPEIGLWQLICSNIKEPVSNESFYCGDACGRPTDHSACDHKFAINAKIKYFLPENIFLKQDVKPPKIDYPFDPINPDYSKNKSPEFVPKDKEMVIMIGYPGSGKSTYANTQIVPHGYVRINNDTLKTKKKCLSECDKALKRGDPVVIDNTNAAKTTRAEYIKMALDNKYTVRCVNVLTSYDLAMHNAAYRERVHNGNHIPELVYRKFKKDYQQPSNDESITEIINVNPVIHNDPLYLMYYM
jgi:bifunctional polynucleotide phosphatase/kinase